MPFLTRFLTTSDFGLIGIIDSILVVCTVVLSLSLEESLRRGYFEERSDFRFFGGTIIFVQLFSSLILGVLFYLILSAYDFYPGIGKPVIILIITAAILAVFKTDFFRLLSAESKSESFAILSISFSLITITGTVIFVAFFEEFKYLGKIYAQLLALVVFAVLVVLDFRKRFKIEFNRKLAGEALKFSLPLIPYRLSGIILTYIDTLILGSLVSLASAGEYSVAYKAGMGVVILNSALFLSMDPNIMRNLGKNESLTNIRDLIEKNAKLFFLFCFVLAAYSEKLVMLLAGSEYKDSVKIVPIIVLSYACTFIYEQFARISKFVKKTYLNTLFLFFSAALNIVLNYLYIPQFGFTAAAYSTLVSSIFLVFISVLYFNWGYRDLSLFIPMKKMFISLSVYCLIYFIGSIFFKNILELIAILMVIWHFKGPRIINKNFGSK